MANYSGLFGNIPTAQLMGQTPPVPSEPVPQKRGGLFSSGGVGRNIVGSIGDALAQFGGMQPVYGPAMEYRQKLADQERILSLKRDQDWQDFQREYDYKAAHPAPVNNDTINDFNWFKSLSEPDRALYQQMHPQYQRVDNGDGTFTIVPMTIGASPAAALPKFTPDDWDKGTPVGGAATPGTPPFRANGPQLDHITMMSESGGNPNAVSEAGARGLFQVMPSTARDPGFGIRPSDGTPADDARVGRQYRRAMQSRYGGNVAKMWAAYNAGPGRVDGALQYGADWLRHLPSETQNYVARNMRALRGN